MATESKSLRRILSSLEDLIEEVDKESELNFEMIEVREILEETLQEIEALG